MSWHLRRRRISLPKPSEPDWSWDYPPPDGIVYGRTLISEGWLRDWPAEAEIALTPEAALAEVSRVVRDRLIASVPNAAAIPHLFRWGVVPWDMMEISHVNFFSARSLEQLLARNFRHVQVGGFQRFPIPDSPPVYKNLFAVGSGPI